MANTHEALSKNGATRKTVGVLFSGGLDSAALVAHYLEKGLRVQPVFVRSSLPWESEEFRAGKKFLKAMSRWNVCTLSEGTVNLEKAYRGNWSQQGPLPSARSSDSDVYLPARNLLLLTKAALILSSKGIDDVALAILKGNPFADAKPFYLKQLADVLSGGFGRHIRIHTPFAGMTKADVIRKLNRYPLHLSLSCISPRKGEHCGKCNKCAERQRAYRLAGVADLTRYGLRGRPRRADAKRSGVLSAGEKA